MTTSLLGRAARGSHSVVNPDYNGKNDGRSQPWIDRNVDGEIVAVTASDSGTTLYVWLLDVECQIHRIDSARVVILPRDHLGALR